MLATFDHADFSLNSLLEIKSEPITVCVPARETASTIQNTVERLLGLCEAGLVDQLLVVDADSTDGTAELARAAGAEVHSENALMPEFGPNRGKGDAMWRILSVTRGDLIVYLDADVSDVGAHYVTGLLGPLMNRKEISFVKGFYQRPFSLGTHEQPEGGGRVTELTAKPLLDFNVPALGNFHQPLAGELSARRSLLESIPFVTAYGVEIAMLVDAWAQVGMDGMAQVNLGSKRNSHQSLTDLGRMAREVTEALALSLDRHQKITIGSMRPAPGHEVRLQTRPPLRDTVTQAKK